jgi:hypothetical protein
MGHSNTRSKEPDQPNVDSQPFKENYSLRSSETSMDLRMYMFLTYTLQKFYGPFYPQFSLRLVQNSKF